MQPKSDYQRHMERTRQQAESTYTNPVARKELWSKMTFTRRPITYFSEKSGLPIETIKELQFREPTQAENLLLLPLTKDIIY